MKKIFLMLAKIFMLVVWGVLLLNLIQPFAGSMHIALNVMGIFMLLMHGLQVLMLTKLSAGQISLTTKEKLSIWLFGSFAMADLKDKIMQQIQAKSADKTDTK